VGRSEERGVRHSTRRGHFNRISCAYGMNETQNWIRIREPVKSAARTDTITGTRLTWCRMIDDQMQRRKNRRMRPITQIAMRTAHRQPRHHHAQQPGSYAGRGLDGRLHYRIILPQGIAEGDRWAFRDSFWIAPDDGQPAPYPSLAVRARNVRVADPSGAIRPPCLKRIERGSTLYDR
jgi:hypothetical protein